MNKKTIYTFVFEGPEIEKNFFAYEFLGTKCVAGSIGNILDKVDKLEADKAALVDALELTLIAINDYAEYEHSGDPYEEDRRAMGEMEIDDMINDGRLDLIKSALAKVKGDL